MQPIECATNMAGFKVLIPACLNTPARSAAKDSIVKTLSGCVGLRPWLQVRDDWRVELRGGPKTVDKNDVGLAGTETSVIQGLAIDGRQSHGGTNGAGRIAELEGRLESYSINRRVDAGDPVTKGPDPGNGNRNLTAILEEQRGMPRPAIEHGTAIGRWPSLAPNSLRRDAVRNKTPELGLNSRCEGTHLHI